MKCVSLAGSKVIESAFAEQVRKQSGVEINRCYQCMTCTLSCPSAFTMDYHPNQLIRLIQLGARTEVLGSSTIWLCASCETCVTRCPNEIDIPRLMDTLRQISVRERVPSRETTAPILNRLFLQGIERWGKPYELGMLIGLKLRVRDFFSDLDIGLRMLRKGKLSLLPGKIRGRRDIRNIFRRSGEPNE